MATYKSTSIGYIVPKLGRVKVPELTRMDVAEVMRDMAKDSLHGQSDSVLFEQDAQHG